MLAQNDLGHLPNTSTICTTIISNAQKHSIPTVMYPVCFSSSAPALWSFLLHRTTHDCYPITAVFLQFYLPRAIASSDFFKPFPAAHLPQRLSSFHARPLMHTSHFSCNDFNVAKKMFQPFCIFIISLLPFCFFLALFSFFLLLLISDCIFAIFPKTL